MSVKYQNTISGLINKRAELLGEAQILRDRLAAARNSIGSTDRVLESLGYTESLDAMRPQGVRLLIFDRSELRKFPIEELRRDPRPSQAAKLLAAS